MDKWKEAFNKAETPEDQVRVLFKEVVRLRGLYENQKGITAHTELWLESHRRLAREKGCDDLARLIEILDESEAEE